MTDPLKDIALSVGGPDAADQIATRRDSEDDFEFAGFTGANARFVADLFDGIPDPDPDVVRGTSDGKVSTVSAEAYSAMLFAADQGDEHVAQILEDARDGKPGAAEALASLAERFS